MAPQPSQTEMERRAAILDELMRSHRRQLRAQAARHSPKKRNVGDALADASVAFLQFYQGAAGVDAVRYMFVCVRTAAWEIERRRRRLEERDAAAALSERLAREQMAHVRDPGEEPHERIELSELTRERKGLLAQLKPDERTALGLFACGYSYQEIRDRQGWTHAKVNRCMAEGRERLRELLVARGERS